jgi:hypothetical protein
MLSPALLWPLHTSTQWLLYPSAPRRVEGAVCHGNVYIYGFRSRANVRTFQRARSANTPYGRACFGFQVSLVRRFSLLQVRCIIVSGQHQFIPYKCAVPVDSPALPQMHSPWRVYRRRSYKIARPAPMLNATTTYRDTGMHERKRRCSLRV